MATDLSERLKVGAGVAGSLWSRARQLPRAMLGMMVAHLGIAAFAFGVSMVNTYEVERDLKMDIGDTTEIAGYVFTFRGVRDRARAQLRRRRRGWSRSRATASRWRRCAPRSASTACSRTR